MNIPQTLTKYPKNRPSNPVQVKKVGISTKKNGFLDKKSGGCQLLSRVYPEISGFLPRKRSPSPRKRSQEGSPASPGEAGRGRGTGQKDTLDERCPVWCIPPNPERSKIDDQSKRRGNRFSGKISLPSLTPLRGGSVTEILANSCKFPSWSLVGWRKGPVGSRNSGQLDDFLKSEKKRGQMRAFGCHSGQKPGFQLKNIIFPKDPIFFGSFRPISVSGGFFPPNC